MVTKNDTHSYTCNILTCGFNINFKYLEYKAKRYCQRMIPLCKSP